MPTNKQDQPADNESDMQRAMREAMEDAQASADASAAADAQDADAALEATENYVQGADSENVTDSTSDTTDASQQPVGAVVNDHSSTPHLPGADAAKQNLKQPWILAELVSKVADGKATVDTGKVKNISIPADYMPDGWAVMFQQYLDQQQPGKGKPSVDGKPSGGWYTVNDVILSVLAERIGHRYRAEIHTTVQSTGAKAGEFFTKPVRSMLTEAQSLVLAPYATKYPLRIGEMVLTFNKYLTGELGASNGIDAKAWLRSVAIECDLPITVFDKVSGWKNTEPAK